MKRLAPLMLCVMGAPLYATEATSWRDRLQVHSFVSQAYLHTSDNRFFGHSENGSIDFTELGINANFELAPSVRLAGQLLSRRAGKMGDGSPHIDYALIDLNFVSAPSGRFGSYIGRIKNPIGLFNETRDVAHTREGILLPQSIYFDRVRNLILSSDGIHLYADWYLDNGALMLQAGAGYPLTDKNVEVSFLGLEPDGDLDPARPGLFGRLLYEHDGGRWIYSLTGARISVDFDPGGADRLPFPAGPGLKKGRFDVDYTVLSAQYNGEKWRFTAETALENLDYSGISPFHQGQSTNTFGYFLQTNYRFSPRWQAFVRYEEFRADKDSRNGRSLARKSEAYSALLAESGIIQPAMPAHAFYYRNWVIGGRWDISPSFMLRAEYHRSSGTAILSPRENDLTASTRKWDLFTISASYKF